jgi:DinB superfamily
MTTPIADLLDRLDRAEARLATHADAPPPGLTEPDAKTGEQWDAGQAWAHLAEMVPYWRGQIGRVLEPGAMRPVSFGRVSTDPGRLSGIEDGRHEPPAEQMARLAAALAEVREDITRMSDDDLAVEGTHPTLGSMNVRGMIERFLAHHLEEHAEQLDRLRDRAG